MSYQVLIHFDPPRLEYQLYIWEEWDTTRRILHTNENDLYRFDDWPRGEATAPTLRIPGHGQDVLQGLAAQLAQLGFGNLTSTPVVQAQEKHIVSLEKQAERLFTLAGGINVRAEEVSVSGTKESLKQI